MTARKPAGNSKAFGTTARDFLTRSFERQHAGTGRQCGQIASGHFSIFVSDSIVGELTSHLIQMDFTLATVVPTNVRQTIFHFVSGLAPLPEWF
jgi:hypothetical protein